MLLGHLSKCEWHGRPVRVKRHKLPMLCEDVRMESARESRQGIPARSKGRECVKESARGRRHVAYSLFGNHIVCVCIQLPKFSSNCIEASCIPSSMRPNFSHCPNSQKSIASAVPQHLPKLLLLASRDFMGTDLFAERHGWYAERLPLAALVSRLIVFFHLILRDAPRRVLDEPTHNSM